MSAVFMHLSELFRFYLSSFRRASASSLLAVIMDSFSQVSMSLQSPQVAYPLLKAHCLIGQRDSQKGVFTPSVLHPRQLIISGVISVLFSSDHSCAVFFLNSSSSLTVASLASQFSQSSPQYAIRSFICFLSRKRSCRF